jgi:2-oxoglutarate ferredoxin oxidoreductase subunit delta
MVEIQLELERCKNCGYCEYFCPSKAISYGDYINKAGYRTIRVDETACVKCGICYTVCPDNVISLIDLEEEG